MKLILLMFLSLFLFIPPANAQDLATEHTQIANSIQLITENIRILESLYNETQMINNQIQQLKSVATYQGGFTDVNATNSNIFSLINQGVSISNQTQAILNQMQQEAQTLMNGSSNGTTMADQEASLGQGTMSIVQTALNSVQTQRQSYQQETNALNSLLNKSNQSIGETQALQTLNEITAQLVPQMQMMRELLSEQITLQSALINKENQEKQMTTNTVNQVFHPVAQGSSSFDLGS